MRYIVHLVFASRDTQFITLLLCKMLSFSRLFILFTRVCVCLHFDVRTECFNLLCMVFNNNVVVKYAWQTCDVRREKYLKFKCHFKRRCLNLTNLKIKLNKKNIMCLYETLCTKRVKILTFLYQSLMS